MSVADIFMPSVASLNAGAMGIILGFLALEYSLINDKVFVALVITAIATSMMSGPLIQWAMRGRGVVREGMSPLFSKSGGFHKNKPETEPHTKRAP